MKRRVSSLPWLPSSSIWKESTKNKEKLLATNRRNLTQSKVSLPFGCHMDFRFGFRFSFRIWLLSFALFIEPQKKKKKPSELYWKFKTKPRTIQPTNEFRAGNNGSQSLQ
ncbi:uncharacterized protein LOC110186970 isoform X2 [Drosophila serrata]|uniref:uncharacterized protein LOC110186970 isoform X2 n=1 Tax=Drosophila serrata TaxID=7274 RepID=UPI000A1D0248|nr:uncharacterized protein LOC110186970 isoform X2 [Drosophila serrata]